MQFERTFANSVEAEGMKMKCDGEEGLPDMCDVACKLGYILTQAEKAGRRDINATHNVVKHDM